MIHNKRTILIADDSDINRGILRMIFEEQFNILEAKDGAIATELLAKYADSIVLIFLDLIMPQKNGLEVMEYMHDNNMMANIPVIMITGEATTESDTKAYEYGASDIIYKPFDAKVVMRRTKNILELFDHRRDMENQLEIRTKELMEKRRKLEQSNEFLVNAFKLRCRI